MLKGPLFAYFALSGSERTRKASERYLKATAFQVLSAERSDPKGPFRCLSDAFGTLRNLSETGAPLLKRPQRFRKVPHPSATSRTIVDSGNAIPSLLRTARYPCIRHAMTNQQGTCTPWKLRNSPACTDRFSLVQLTPLARVSTAPCGQPIIHTVHVNDMGQAGARQPRVDQLPPVKSVSQVSLEPPMLCFLPFSHHFLIFSGGCRKVWWLWSKSVQFTTFGQPKRIDPNQGVRLSPRL